MHLGCFLEVYLNSAFVLIFTSNRASFAFVAPPRGVSKQGISVYLLHQQGPLECIETMHLSSVSQVNEGLLHKQGLVEECRTTASVLMVNHVCDSLADATAAKKKKKPIADSLDGIPWLADAASSSKRKYVEMVARKSSASGKKLPAPVADAAERRVKMQKIIANAAQKLKDEAAEKKANAEARQLDLVREAARAFLRQEYGTSKKQKATPTEVQEKLARACRCSLTVASGLHEDRCNLHPATMRSILPRNVENRTAVEGSPQQREAALQHLFGPAEVIGASSASGALAGVRPTAKNHKYGGG